jgi:hypothetical protein
MPNLLFRLNPKRFRRITGEMLEELRRDYL